MINLSDESELAGDILASITADAIDELDNNEPPCLNDLREASEAEFRYDILDELETGGMKHVYRAIDKQTCRDVALAFIKTDGLSEKTIRYFIQEAWITARLEHPNIVPIHDIGISPDGEPYFAMKLLSGETLSSIIGKLSSKNPDYQDKFSCRQLLEIFIKICDAISYAHKNDVIHLDLKPENIQVSDFGQVLVLDWGIASLLEMSDESYEEESTPLEEIEHTLCGSVKGTPGYIAPELLNTKQYKPDFKADIYGLGAILFSLVTYQRAKGNLSSDHPAMDNIPLTLRHIIRKAMQVDPSLRYSTVSDFQSDIKAYLTGHITQAENPGFIRQLMLLIKRNKRVFTTITIFIIILAIATTAAFIRLTASERQAQEQKIIAQKMLKKYELERGERERREKTSFTYYMSRAYTAMGQCRLQDTLREVELAIKMDPTSEEAQKIKLDTLVALQKFRQALTMKANQNFQPIRYRLVTKYAAIKDDSRLLTADEANMYVKDLLRHNVTKKSSLMNAIFYIINNGKTFVEQQQFVTESIATLYPRSRAVYNAEKDRVTIETTSIHFLPLLSGLSFKQLDLSKAKIYNFRPILTMKDLEYLNLKNTDISQPESLKALPKLKYLNVENTRLSYLVTPKVAIQLDYLNIARTDLTGYQQSKASVSVLNAVEAYDTNLLSIASHANPPKVILVSHEQLKGNMPFKDMCRKRGIDLRLYNSADEVREEEFLTKL